MAFDKTEFIWFNGELVPWDQATVHVTVHALHYGSSVFEDFPPGAARRPAFQLVQNLPDGYRL